MPHNMGMQLSRLERMTIGHEVEGSSPSVPSKAYVSVGLEMINRPIRYLQKDNVSDEKRSSTLGEIKTVVTNVSFDTNKQQARRCA